jgi:hypothetical protein
MNLEKAMQIDLPSAVDLILRVRDLDRDFTDDETGAILDLGHEISQSLNGRVATPDEQLVLDTGSRIRQSDGYLAEFWIGVPGGDIRAKDFLHRPADKE